MLGACPYQKWSIVLVIGNHTFVERSKDPTVDLTIGYVFEESVDALLIHKIRNLTLKPTGFQVWASRCMVLSVRVNTNIGNTAPKASMSAHFSDFTFVLTSRLRQFTSQRSLARKVNRLFKGCVLGPLDSCTWVL